MDNNHNVLSIPGEKFALPGVTVTDIEVDAAKELTTIYAVTDFGLPSVCPNCGRKLTSHGYRTVTIFHSPMCGFPAEIKLSKARKRCASCKVMWNCAPLSFMIGDSDDEENKSQSDGNTSAPPNENATEQNNRKLFKSTLNNRLHRNLACVIDKSSRGAKLKRAFEELPIYKMQMLQIN